MKRRSAIEDLKFLQNELVMIGEKRLPSLDIAITDMERLEKIEQILSESNPCYALEDLEKIKEVIGE